MTLLSLLILNASPLLHLSLLFLPPFFLLHPYHLYLLIPPLPGFLFPLYPFISTILMIIKMGEPYFITLYQSILSYLYFLLFSIQYFPLPPLSTYLPLPSLPLPLQ